MLYVLLVHSDPLTSRSNHIASVYNIPGFEVFENHIRPQSYTHISKHASCVMRYSNVRPFSNNLQIPSLCK